MQFFQSSESNFHSAFKFSDLTPKVQNHIKNVYQVLALTIGAAGLGVLAHLKYQLGSPVFGLFGLGLVLGVMLTPNTPNNQSMRTSFLLGFGLLEGLTIAPLVEAVLEVDPSIVLSALLATTAIFVCFSLSALWSTRRSMLYLGGFLSSAISALCMIGFINLFYPSEAAFNLALYGGLIVFIGYIMFDTQLMVEMAFAGNLDVQGHALQLFIDIVAIFVRILIILSKDKKKENGSSKRR